MKMIKMRGVASDKFNLHLKETEWRFNNHKNENIYKLLLTALRRNPPPNLLLSHYFFEEWILLPSKLKIRDNANFWL